MADLKELYDAILTGNAKKAAAVTQAALDEGVQPMDMVTQQMVPAMAEVGKLFECEEYFVPELLLSGRAMKACMELLRPLLSKQGVEPVGRVVIGTVKGDLHDIGKNLVACMLEGGGFEVIDLGADVAPDQFVNTVQSKNVKIVALSALLTVTMNSMRTTIQAFRDAGLREHVKIMVGGAPVTQQFADEIGADGFSENASAAVNLARKLVAA
jgi:5-methyltetrahydrofolate--homocysteine methyltransferase